MTDYRWGTGGKWVLALVFASLSFISSTPAANAFSLTGSVYEEVNGDANLSDGSGRAGVTVHLFRDGGDGLTRPH